MLGLNFQMFGAKVPFPEGTEDKVWFYYTGENNETLMVDGLGVAAEVIERDVGASNGVIHVINRVLGLLSDTVFGKIATDPMLS